MGRETLSRELKVGMLVVSALILLMFFLFAIGDLSTLFQPSYRLRVIFESANGISEGAPVQYAGVEVGKVETVRIVYDPQHPAPQVELAIRLPTQMTVRADDQASVSTFGLLGEKYLEILPGPGHGGFLKAGEVLQGKPPVSTERIMEHASDVLNDLKQTLEGLNSLVGDPEARIYLKEAMQEARDATRQWKVLGERMNLGMSNVEAGKGTLGKLLYDDELYQDALGFVDDLKAHPWKLLVKPKKQQQTDATKP